MTRADEARILSTRLLIYCAQHGLATSRVGDYLFHGARCGIKLLGKRKRPAQKTLDRVRDFLNSPPPPGLHKRTRGGARKRRDATTGANLAHALEMVIAERGWSPRAVSLHVFGSPHGIERLRTMKPQARTKARVEAFLRNPVLPRRAKKAQPERPVVSTWQRAKPERPPLTFEEKLALVASGKARVVPVVRMPQRTHSMSLTGCAGAMVAGV